MIEQLAKRSKGKMVMIPRQKLTDLFFQVLDGFGQRLGRNKQMICGQGKLTILIKLGKIAQLLDIHGVFISSKTELLVEDQLNCSCLTQKSQYLIIRADGKKPPKYIRKEEKLK